ncbi:MAG: adenylate/guanylate cyclase domain-containing protein [Myxococcaceae bacterium]
MAKAARTILVVDDEYVITAGLRRLLASEGFTVHVAKDGVEGLELLKTQPVQMVISDKEMPNMGGIEFLGLVRDRYPRVCRIMLTGNSDFQSAVGAINQGEVFRFIEKPWNAEHLLSTIRFAFDALELEEENRELAERSDRLLLNVLPRSIAERLKQGRVGVIADRFPAATVLFADLVDFTPLSASLEPAALIGLLDAIFSAFDQLAEKYGVEKIKTIGDGYLAAAGLPEPRPDHVQAAGQMALEMLTSLQAINAARGVQLSLRIGLHTGPVVAGVIGLKKFSYDLWGDTVNLASRMESLGVPGKIHVTDPIVAALGKDYAFEARGPIAVKGKGTVNTHFLLGKR